MLAQIDHLSEKLHIEAIENAELLEKTPPEFFIKAGILIVAVISLTLLARSYFKKR